MPEFVTNPYNKIDWSRLAGETSLDFNTDLLAFHDASALPPNRERKITIQQVLDAIIPTLTTAIMPTGIVAAYAGLTAPNGWLLVSNLTIGATASGATARANPDTLALYNLLWASFSNTELVIQTSGGAPTTRGISSAADFQANKRLPLLDLRGRVIAGLGNMGGTSANRLTSVLSGVSGDVPGATGGLESHTLIVDEIPAHTHDVDVPGTTATSAATGADVSTPDATAPVTSTSVGGGDPHNNVQPTIILPYIIKL